MLTRISSAVGRHRRAALAVALLVAVAYLAVQIWAPISDDLAFSLIFIPIFGTLGLSVLGLSGRATGTFDVRPQVPAFTAPPRPAVVLLMLGQLLLAVALTEDAVRDLWSNESLLDQWPALLRDVIAVLLIVSIWRGTGIELRPGGLRDRDGTGTLLVPWDALPTVHVPDDQRSVLSVRYGRPDLVRRHGLIVSRKQLGTGNVDRALAARVIAHYVAHPEHRTAIGSHAEYERVLRETRDAPDGGA